MVGHSGSRHTLGCAKTAVVCFCCLSTHCGRDPLLTDVRVTPLLSATLYCVCARQENPGVPKLVITSSHRAEDSQPSGLGKEEAGGLS